MMNNSSNQPHPFEPGRDELPSKPQYNFEFDRRKFFKLFGGGLAVAFCVARHFFIRRVRHHRRITIKQIPGQVNAWIHIGEDGTVSVYTGKVEVGQNIRTSLSQIVAEELYVPISSIKMIMGDTDLVPYDAGTFGSRTTPQMGTQLRKAAATARGALLEMAAKNWSTTTEKLSAKDGVIVDRANNKKIGFGELTKGQQLLLPIADNVRVTAAVDWKVAGKTVTKINGRSFITGKHQYVSDMKLTGMLYGKILRPSFL
jgi:isoquinoline 1-oxidoreductase